MIDARRSPVPTARRSRDPKGKTTGNVLLGTFTDANQAATVADFTTAPGSVVVNWGDARCPETLTAANLTAVGTPNGVTGSSTPPTSTRGEPRLLRHGDR